jgi:hypothetical protein
MGHSSWKLAEVHYKHELKRWKTLYFQAFAPKTRCICRQGVAHLFRAYSLSLQGLIRWKALESPVRRPSAVVALPAALIPLKIFHNLANVSQRAFRVCGLEIQGLVGCSTPKLSAIVGLENICPVIPSLYAAVSVFELSTNLLSNGRIPGVI